MKGKMSCALIMTALMTTVVPTAFAADNYQPIAIQSNDNDSMIAPYADVIVIKTRLYKGKQQYRR